MRFMIVCKKLNEQISRNIIVAYWGTCARLKAQNAENINDYFETKFDVLPAS